MRDVTTARAPLVVKLFGEHAVVYGYRALAAALDLKVEVSVEDSRTREHIIESALGLEKVSELDPDKAKHKYIVQALRLISTEVLGRELRPLRITVRSPVPPSCGLATSAAVTIATLAAVSRHLGVNLAKEDIARLGHRVEQLVQGRASPMDTYTSTVGGLTLIHPRENKLLKLDVPVSLELSIILAKRRRATKDLVTQVYNLYTKCREVVESIFELIDQICARAVIAIRELNFSELGTLMYINHSLLSALGVSNPHIDYLVSLLRERRVLGAKLSGAGDGGTILVIGELDENLKSEIRHILGEYYIDVLERVRLNYTGVEIED